jgi:hypothetical protein
MHITFIRNVNGDCARDDDVKQIADGVELKYNLVFVQLEQGQALRNVDVVLLGNVSFLEELDCLYERHDLFVVFMRSLLIGLAEYI